MEFIKFWESGEKTKDNNLIQFLNMVRILERFQGWDYYTYMQQPSFFLDNLLNYYSSQKEFEDQFNKGK